MRFRGGYLAAAVLIAVAAGGLFLLRATAREEVFLPETVAPDVGATPSPPLARTPVVVEQVSDAVVAVLRRRRAGSGVVLGHDLVVTAASVVGHMGEVAIVTGAGQRLRAERVAVDAVTGVAVLRVRGRRLAPAAPSDRLPRIGEPIVTLFRSASGAERVAAGVVAGLARGRHADVTLDRLISDADPGPAAEGAALADLDGQLVGLVTAAPRGRHSSSVPAVVVRALVTRLLAGAGAAHPYLGLRVVQLPAERARRLRRRAGAGVVVVEVAPRSPAAHGGIRRDDVIVGVDGRRVNAVNDLVAALVRGAPGSRTSLDLVRGRRMLTVETVLAAVPAD